MTRPSKTPLPAYQRALLQKEPKNMPVYHEPEGQLPKRKLTALGFTSGVGSMLIGAKEAGFSVVGNLEWRHYYRLVDSDFRNTFIANFPGAFFARGWEDLKSHDQDLLIEREVDLAMGHPECGFFSILNGSNKNYMAQRTDPSDIPLFLHYVATFRPRFFVMDDLPASFTALPVSEYVRLLPDYDLFPEWISNYHYGNIQKSRKRMFMIGALKDEKFTFLPGERDDWDDWTVWTRIGDLEGKYGILPNHDEHVRDVQTSRYLHLRGRDVRSTWRQGAKVFKKLPTRVNMPYIKADGVPAERPCLGRADYEQPCWVLTGSNPVLHPKTAYPFSIRERARIQGFPDDFVFYGTRLDEHGRWNHDLNGPMVKQTGKAMPIEFNRYVARQIKAHIEGKTFKTSKRRFLKPSGMIDQAKQDFCRISGYSNQAQACSCCWLQQSCTLPQRRDEDLF